MTPAVESRPADPYSVRADRRVVGEPAESELARIVRRGREIERKRGARQQVRIEGGGRVTLPRTDRRRAQIVEPERRIDVPGLKLDDEAEAAGRAPDLFDAGIGDTHARRTVDQQQLSF